jgi:branched-chain amino acid transport system substrate-binding protein
MIERGGTAMKRMIIKVVRRSLLVILVASGLSSLPGMAVGTYAHAAEPVKVGIVLSLTGWAGFIGTPQKQAFTAIFDDFNAKGGVGGRQIQYFFEDDQSNPTTAVVAATKLIRDKKVAIMTGPSTTDSGMSMIPICEQEQVPFVVTGPIVSPFRKWAFIVGPGDARLVTHIADVIVNRIGAKRIALLHDAAAYGMTGAKYLNVEIPKYPGSSFIIQEKFETADTNMIPQLTRIKAANPDLMVLFTPGVPASVVAKNYKQLGLKVPVLGSTPVATPDFFRLAGGIAEESGWMFMAAKFFIAEKLPPDDPMRKSLYEPFKKLMKSKFGDSTVLNLFHATSHDGAQAVMEAIRIAGSDDRSSLRDALEKVRIEGFHGAFACTADDHQCAPKDTFTDLMVLKSGQLELYKK